MRGDVAADVQRVDLAQWQADASWWRAQRRPVVIAEAFADSIAVRTWTPETIAERYPNVDVVVQCSPTGTGDPAQSAGGAMTMAQFVSLLREGRACALKQHQVKSTPRLFFELDIARAVAPPYWAVNLWMCNEARSPLHFDQRENVFVQVHGTKRFILEPPTSTARLYMRDGDAAHISWVDPVKLDPGRFPDYDPGQQSIALLGAGDALYIPPGWFHHVTAPGLAISANCWFGDTLSAGEDEEAGERT
jgi:hypothetical protein